MTDPSKQERDPRIEEAYMAWEASFSEEPTAYNDLDVFEAGWLAARDYYEHYKPQWKVDLFRAGISERRQVRKTLSPNQGNSANAEQPRVEAGQIRGNSTGHLLYVEGIEGLLEPGERRPKGSLWHVIEIRGRYPGQRYGMPACDLETWTLSKEDRDE